MQWMCLLFFTAALLGVMTAPVAAATSLSITAFPQQAHIGDVVTLNGTITGITTIAVYLFVTGTELDERGVTLDNLNIPAGRGLFTTAPVNMNDGSWTYTWDTSVILGTLNPGTYTVYVESSPLDRLRYTGGDYAAVDVEFLPSDNPATRAQPEPALPLVAVGFMTVLGIWQNRSRKKA